MKKLWNMLRGKARRDDKGMTFVEVLCAVAILALVSGVIGTVIVMSTRTYRKGISETGIQQEAQLAANNIGNLVKDACTVKYGESGQNYMVNGEEFDEDGNPKVPDATNPALPQKQVDGKTELSIITNEQKQYMVLYEKNDPLDATNPYGKLKYQEFDINPDGTVGNPSSVQVMASNVIDFKADTTDFKKSKTIKLNMTVEDENTKRQIPMEYTMTSRNDAIEGAVFASYTDNASLRFMEDEVVLIPGETYKLQYVSAGVSELPEVESYVNVTLGALTTDYVEVTVPLNTREAAGEVKLRVKDAAGNEITAACPIRIRRVTGVQVSHVTDTKNSQGGMYETAGTVYTFTASVSGSELVKHVAYDYDWNYKTAQAVAWSCVLKVNGAEYTYNWSQARNANQEWEFTKPDFSTGAFADYFEVDDASTKEDVLVPSFAIKLKKTMPADFELTVRATSKHALGWNKAMTKKEGEIVYPVDTKYYDAYGSDPATVYYGEDTIKPRATKLNEGLEITLEPLEDGLVPLGMKGGLTDNVQFDLHGATDSSTKAEYIKSGENKGKVKITLGKNERGSGDRDEHGNVPPNPYTFTIDAKPDNNADLKTTITVHVRRVDTVHIDAVRNADDNTTMDLKLRFNADTESTKIIQYLVDSTDQKVLGQALTTRVTIEVLDKNNNVNDALTQEAIWGTYEGTARDKEKEESEIITKTKGAWKKDLTDLTNDGKIIYRIENTKPARISKNDTSWKLEQTPELDIKPMSLGAGEKIRVTMEALHPVGTNNTGETYIGSGVKDVCTLYGQEIIDVAKKNDEIIVEPYQVKDQGNGAMTIPVYLARSVAAIKVKLEGNDTNTRVLDGEIDPEDDSIVKLVKPAETDVINLGLNVSRTEEGETFDGKAGRIKMTITAYSETDMKSAALLDTLEVYLGVRRVTDVTIKDKDSFVNKVGATVTLKAQATGLEGTEYFDRQVKGSDEKYEPVWDSSDKYKSPYALKWSLYYDGKETAISNSSEYFSGVKDVTSSDRKTPAIQFTLEKELPVGAQIRATSVHAGNKDGKAENRSGLNYVKDIDQYKKTYPEGIVFDYIEVQKAVSGWKRGGLYDIASIIPEKYVKTEYNADGTIKAQWLVDDDGNPIAGNDTNSLFKFSSKYPVSYFSDINHQSRSQDFGSNTRADSLINFVGDSNVLVDYQAQLVTEPAERAKLYSYSSPYPSPSGYYWLDLSQVYVKVNVGGGSWIDNPDSLAIVEEYYDVEDVVFQYRNSLPETSTQSGDSDGAWSSKSNNTTIVYVTADDTIGSYNSYYKLSEGWEETYERYTLLPERYVGVINDDKNNDSLDERLFDFDVTNTISEGGVDGRSYVSFTFSKDVRKTYTGKIVKMIYEYNPFLCDTADPYGPHSSFEKAKLEEVDGCDGILEFHFVDANINTKSGVTMPEVRYCPTYSDNKSSATPNYYYISTTSRFYINSDGKTAQYQTGGVGKWTTKYSMTYANGKWTIQ